jgi:DNA-directed RNA polymerase specialized sigma24 family protein
MKVRILELRYFLGSTAEETAELLGVSKTTVDRAVRFGITWLHHRLTQTGATQETGE